MAAVVATPNSSAFAAATVAAVHAFATAAATARGRKVPALSIPAPRQAEVNWVTLCLSPQQEDELLQTTALQLARPESPDSTFSQDSDESASQWCNAAAAAVAADGPTTTLLLDSPIFDPYDDIDVDDEDAVAEVASFLEQPTTTAATATATAAGAGVGATTTISMAAQCPTTATTTTVVLPLVTPTQEARDTTVVASPWNRMRQAQQQQKQQQKQQRRRLAGKRSRGGDSYGAGIAECRVKTQRTGVHHHAPCTVEVATLLLQAAELAVHDKQPAKAPQQQQQQQQQQQHQKRARFVARRSHIAAALKQANASSSTTTTTAAPVAAKPFSTGKQGTGKQARRVCFHASAKTHDGLEPNNALFDALVWDFFGGNVAGTQRNFRRMLAGGDACVRAMAARCQRLEERIGAAGQAPVLPRGGGNVARLSAIHLPRLNDLHAMVLEVGMGLAPRTPVLPSATTSAAAAAAAAAASTAVRVRTPRPRASSASGTLVQVCA